MGPRRRKAFDIFPVWREFQIGSDYATFTGRDVYIRTKSMQESPEQDNILLYDSRSASKQIDRIRRVVLLKPRRQTGTYNRNRGERSYYIRNESNFSPQLGPSFNCRRGRRSAIGTRFPDDFVGSPRNRGQFREGGYQQCMDSIVTTQVIPIICGTHYSTGKDDKTR